MIHELNAGLQTASARYTGEVGEEVCALLPDRATVNIVQRTLPGYTTHLVADANS